MSQISSHSDMLQSLLSHQQEIYRFAAQIDSRVQLFGLNDIPVSQDSLWECHFQRLVSWLYILYWEIGKKADLQFLINRFRTYELDPLGSYKEHPDIVRSMRTMAQHNVADKGSSIERRTQTICQNWFQSKCSTPNPFEDKHWEMCVLQLIDEAESFLNAVYECLVSIYHDESRDEILKQWKLRRERKFSPWDYDQMIREVMSDLGLEGQRQIVVIRKRYQSTWDKYLESLAFSDDFKSNIKRRILDTLLEKTEILMPLEPDDIIQRFKIEAGDNKIRKLLSHARDLFRSNPDLTKEELLAKLKESLE